MRRMLALPFGALFLLAAVPASAGSAGADQGSRARTMVDLGAIEDFSRATSINDPGVGVGQSGTCLPRCAHRGSRLTLFDKNGPRQLDFQTEVQDFVDASINNRGQIAFSYVFRPVESYLIDGDSAVSIPHLFPDIIGASITARDLNERAQVVGESGGTVLPTEEEPPVHAFVYQDGVTTDLGTLVGPSGTSAALAINQRGVIIGSSTTASGATHATIWSTSGIADLGTLGGDHSVATDINDRGQVVGWSTTSSGAVHAFRWQNGVFTDLGTLGGATSRASAINNNGEVVGESKTPGGDIHAFVWDKGRLIDLGTLGGTQSSATDINARGQIVGDSTTTTGATHAFIS